MTTSDPGALDADPGATPRPGDRRLRPPGPKRASRLVTWDTTTGVDASPGVSGGPVGGVANLEVLAVADGSAEVRERMSELRSEHPDRLVGIVHGVDGRPAAEMDVADIGRLLGSVVACAGGSGVRFPGRVSPPSFAELRGWVGEILRSLDAVTGAPRDVAARDVVVCDTVLLVDEMASNAVEHASGGLAVDISASADRVLVVVSDPHPERLPEVGSPPPLQPSGRGLLVVDALSRRWGFVIGNTVKSVWAEMVWPT